MSIEVEVKVVRNSEGKAIGFQAQGTGSTEANCFCASFPQRFANGHAEVKLLKQGELVLTHPDEGEVRAPLLPEDVLNLRLVLKADTIRVMAENAFGARFRFQAPGETAATLETLNGYDAGEIAQAVDLSDQTFFRRA